LLRFKKILAAAVLMCLMSGAQAASILLVATSNIVDVGVGDLVTFDVWMDFSTNDNGLGSDITLGGGFDIIFNPFALQFQSFTNESIGDPNFGRDPDIFAGLLESWGFGDFAGLTGPALVGTVQFSLLATAPASTFVSTGPTSGIAGPFVSGVDFFTILNVDYSSIEVTPVPLPAAAWLFLTAIGSAFGAKRWKARA